jgi:DNA (cytosine-5)-methyltransferase 1
VIPLLDLFSGIGGFSLGLERTGGFETVAFCEIDKKAQQVLNKHWPDVPIYEDIKELTLERLQSDGVPLPRAICGGFPCQDISLAGKGEGIVGERSGLWAEMFRLIRDVRPTWAIIENVSALRSKGLTLVLQDLSEIGYSCEWHCIPASAVGAPHQRDRVWITAYSNADSNGEPTVSQHDEASGVSEYVAYPMQQPEAPRGKREDTQGQSDLGGTDSGGSCGDADGERPLRVSGDSPSILLREICKTDYWQVEPSVGRVADGVPRRVDRLRQLGNSVVPQIPEMIGRAILEADCDH